MVDQQPNKPMWQRKRYQAASFVWVRAVKRSRTEAGPSASPEVHMLLAGPSAAPELHTPLSPLTEEGSVPSESESENERGNYSSSDKAAEFGEAEAQESLDEFVPSLLSLQRKSLSVLLMHTFN